MSETPPEAASACSELGANQLHRPRQQFDWRAFLIRYQTPLTFLFAVVATGIVIASKVMP